MFTPEQWAREAIGLYRHYNADRVVAEVNNGGDMVEATIRMVDPNVPFTAVRASRGKVARAEPVSALYEQGRMHHVGTFPQLEDQMCAFTSDFDRDAAGYSPDRADGLVWGCTELLVEQMNGWGIFELYRQRAAALEAQKAGLPPPPPTPAAVEYAKRPSLQEVYDAARTHFEKLAQTGLPLVPLLPSSGNSSAMTHSCRPPLKT